MEGIASLKAMSRMMAKKENVVEKSPFFTLPSATGMGKLLLKRNLVLIIVTFR